MSDLSPLYSEYEKISGLFRKLNEAILIERQARLGIKTPSITEEDQIREKLDSALGQLSDQGGGKAASYSGLLAQLESEDFDISPTTITTIRRRAQNGLSTLTEQDLKVIERVTDVLDSRSELLFRRIQK